MFSAHPNIRIAIYLAAVSFQIVSIFVAVYNAELGGAFLAASGVLSVVATGTALSNVKPADQA